MLARFWGTRGSLSAPLSALDVRNKIGAALAKSNGRDLSTPKAIDAFIDSELDFAESGTYGGNTSCVEIDNGGDEYVLCDLGTGARVFGNHFLANADKKPTKTFNIFLSHIHWDHIMGFPFFVPAYIPGHKIRILGCHDGMEETFRRQHRAPNFPVDFSLLGADIEFVTLTPGTPHKVGGMTVTPFLQLHGGDSYGYRFEQDGKAIVYSTDAEHKPEDIDDTDQFVEFCRDADLVIFDAMYSLAEAVSIKEDWGHSSNIVGVELCQRAGVKHYCMFHHEPIFSDERLDSVLAETIRYGEISQEGAAGHRMKISTAYDGMEIEI